MTIKKERLAAQATTALEVQMLCSVLLLLSQWSPASRFNLI